MTAVEWLVKNVVISAPINWDSTILQKAKEMEKQQIMDAHFAAQIEDIRFWDEAKQEALDYYNETFKSE